MLHLAESLCFFRLDAFVHKLVAANQLVNLWLGQWEICAFARFDRPKDVKLLASCELSITKSANLKFSRELNTLQTVVVCFLQQTQDSAELGSRHSKACTAFNKSTY